MKKTIVTIIIFASSLLLAQTEQQSIELPDFVITGKQNINVPVAVKKKPDFISTLSQEFFTPQFAPEELPLLISSEPAPVRPGIKTFNDNINGTLKIKVSQYALPVGELNLNQSFDNALFSAKAWGSNIKEYITNAGYNNSGVSLTNEFFFNTRSDFLPGAKIKVGAEYTRDSYRLFASQTPTFKRETNNGSAVMSIANSYNRWVNFGFGLLGNILSLSENGLKETNFSSNGFFEFKQSNFSIGVKGSCSKQILDKNLSGIKGDDFFSTEGYVKLFPTNELNFTVGINYASNSSNSFFAPFGSIEFKLNKGLILSAEFNPHVKYFTVTDFIKRNIYFNPGMTDDVFLKYTADINGVLKYEYEKLFAISLSGGYAKLSNYFYFDDAVNSGKFDLNILPDAKILSGGFSFIFYPAKYGHFFGEFFYRNVEDQLDHLVPYEPKISASLTYGYNFEIGLGLRVRYHLAYDVLTNLVTADKLNNYHDVSLSLNYEILNGLKLTADFQNMLNRTNFVWKQYQEKPFDVLLGIEYRW